MVTLKALVHGHMINFDIIQTHEFCSLSCITLPTYLFNLTFSFPFQVYSGEGAAGLTVGEGGEVQGPQPALREGPEVRRGDRDCDVW